jgi:primary-amine oxidase
MVEILIILLLGLAGILAQTPAHPLDPLSPAEISLTASIITTTQASNTGWLFNWITLLEPEKSVLLPLLFVGDNERSRIPRRSFTVLIERRTGRVFEIIVNLNLRRVEKVEQLPPGTQPTLTPEELTSAENIFKADAAVRERCARLGFTDMANVVGDSWLVNNSFISLNSNTLLDLIFVFQGYWLH